MTFVEAHRHTFGVAPLLAAIGEPVSTFYDRTSRTPSARAMADAAVAERIEAIWERSRRTYGAPRIHAMLAREGIWVGRKRVERLMRQLGIQGAHLIGHGENDRYDGGHADPDDAAPDDGPAAVWVSSPVASAGSAANPPQQKIFTYRRRALIQSAKKRLATIVSEKHA